jgi:hypothetical protein
MSAELYRPIELTFPGYRDPITGLCYTLDGKRQLTPGTNKYTLYFGEGIVLSPEETSFLVKKVTRLESHYRAINHDVQRLATLLRDNEYNGMRDILL